MSIDCDSYGCDKLTTHCTKQRAALGSPNIQRNSSHPAETQTCFVSSAVLANLFESTHLYNLIKKKTVKASGLYCFGVSLRVNPVREQIQTLNLVGFHFQM